METAPSSARRLARRVGGRRGAVAARAVERLLEVARLGLGGRRPSQGAVGVVGGLGQGAVGLARRAARSVRFSSRRRATNCSPGSRSRFRCTATALTAPQRRANLKVAADSARVLRVGG